MASISVIRKKRGRPQTGQDPVTAIRLSRQITAALDKEAEASGDGSRSEAIRRILAGYLKRRGLLKADQPDNLARAEKAVRAHHAARDEVRHIQKGGTESDTEKRERRRRLTKLPAELRRR
jgi:hypothetical protein